jgi:hypothetical protein
LERKTELNSLSDEKGVCPVPYWPDQLREVLRAFYPPEGPADVLGYLKGSGDPNIWRLKAMQHKPQFLILGSTPPTAEEWVNAGKPGPDPIQTVCTNDLWGFIILHGALNPRPWGRIEIVDMEALNNYQSTTIDKFRHELARH